MQPSRPLLAEQLEDRSTPATSGVIWPDGAHLTLSFVPDGTRVNGYRSNLFATLDAVAPRGAWQREVLRAFQTWAQYADINVGVVPDSGWPLGAPGAVQGASGFGDIRIAAIPLTAGTLATNTPFQWSGTTWSGDVLLNSNYLFSANRRPGTYDLFSVMLNESGNVFGVLDNTTDPTSAVYHRYAGPRGGLNPEDVADIQTLYGVRSPDEFDRVNSDSFARANSDSTSDAENLGGSPDRLNAEADISDAGDVDVYRFTVSTSEPVAAFTAKVTTSGLSSLVPRLEVYDSLGVLLDSVVSVDPLRGDLTVRIVQPAPGSAYYLRVGGNSPTAFGVGGYRLSVVHEYADGTTSSLASTDPVPVSDDHTNDDAASATNLTARKYTSDARFDITYRGVVGDSRDADYYKIHSPSAATGPQKLNVLVWSTDGRLVPKLEVFDEYYNPVAARLLANEGGTYSLEVPDTTPGATYYVKVGALHPSGRRGTGSYFLAIDFSAQPETVFRSQAGGVLSRAVRQRFAALTVSENSLQEFVLAAQAGPLGAWTQVAMEIYDASRRPVFRLAAYSGQPASTGHVYLRAGTYTVRFSVAAPRWAPLRPTYFSLLGRLISDPIGPLTDGDTPTTATTTWSTSFTPISSTTLTWWIPYYF